MNGVNENGELTNAFFVANDLTNGGEYDYDSHQVTESTDADGNTVKTYKGSYYYTFLNAKNFTVCSEAMKDSSTISTSSQKAFNNGVDSYDIVEKLLDLKDKTKIFRGGVAGDFLQCLLSDISVDTQKTQIFTNNYENLQQAILNQRMSISAVDSDEEALDLVKFQNAYNLSSKMVSVLQEMYNQLILNTGA
jgi:flagellar hook-associated protein 1 FlgK